MLRSVTSHRTASALRPRPWISSTVFSVCTIPCATAACASTPYSSAALVSDSTRMSAIATSAPARASVSASARPRPREPPVTSATRPVRSISRAIRAILRSGWDAISPRPAEASRAERSQRGAMPADVTIAAPSGPQTGCGSPSTSAGHDSPSATGSPRPRVPPTRTRRCARWSRSTRRTRRPSSSRHGPGPAASSRPTSSTRCTRSERSCGCWACAGRSGSSHASLPRSSTRRAPA